MPEGPEVHTFADWLRDHLVGLILINIHMTDRSRYVKKGLPRLNEIMDYFPMTVIDVMAKGKKIVFMLEGKDGTNLYFVSSLGMEGKWTYTQDKHSDLWFEFDAADPLYFDDSRHFGSLEIFLTSQDLLARMSEVGPDLISDEITDELWLSKIRNRRIKTKKIGLFLMEQKHFSGIGNYLRAEILYAARISPHRPIGSLSDEEALRILDEARIIIQASYQAQGASLMSYLNPHGGKGSFKVTIYKKKMDLLGNPVISEDLGDKRTMHWVPSIQM